MPLNNNLNQHLHNDVSRQVAATMSIEGTDKRKFSTSTPNQLTTAYLKVWNCVGPTPSRIVENFLQVGPSWEAIYNNNGGYVSNIPRKGKTEKHVNQSILTSTTETTWRCKKKVIGTN
jgi:hypothetical protein